MAQVMTTFNAPPDAPDARQTAALAWLATVLPTPPEALRPASADASFRRYFRLHDGARWLILMDAPPTLEPVAPFLRVAGWLRDCGLHVPAVLAVNAEAGFLLLEDLGQTSYFAALQADPAQADVLYPDALEALVTLQVGGQRFLDALPPYDAALLEREMALFRDWLCLRHLGLALSGAEEAMLAAAFAALRDAALAQPRVFVHRDYHSRNLMVCAAANPGVLDFQDAVAGPLTYDVVSLLKDCYLRWPPADRARWIGVYHAAAVCRGLPVGELAAFTAALDVMGIQRHLKAAGIFARLWHRDGKPGYLGDLPTTLDYVVEAAAGQPALAPLGEFIARRVLPALPPVVRPGPVL
ncbi:MAG: phosphotransferase [Gammaproteobacteria bacterium]|nr:phosphotransferase [Gammaproteobacteria bacterium]TVQ49347.1 MAG: aminoglycoside phosphotransferase [Gammaproteobacteria bacterium]